jgi:hypothetical protein
MNVQPRTGRLWLTLLALAGSLLGCAPERSTAPDRSTAPERSSSFPAPGGAPLALEIWRVHPEGDGLAAVLPLEPAGTFTLHFTHSMYGGLVSERYEVTNVPAPRLRRLDVRTTNGGAAEYYARYGNFRQDAGQWVLDLPPLSLTSLRLRVDQTGRPELQTGARRTELMGLIPDGEVVELRPAGATVAPP